MSNPARKLKLDGAMIDAFYKAIFEEFPVAADLVQVVQARLRRSFVDTAQDVRYKKNIYYFVQAVNDDEESGLLLESLLVERPSSKPLLRFALAIGYLPSSETPGALEAITRDPDSFSNIAIEAEWLLRVMRQVCKIDIPGSGATGLLVGPDLVLTNYHVYQKFAGNIENVRCVFDYYVLPGGVSVNPGRAIRLDPNWEVVSRPYSPSDQILDPPNSPAEHELDYALLRLAEPMGSQPIQPGQNGMVRGWVALSPNVAPTAIGDDILVIQHPKPQGVEQLPLQKSNGRVIKTPWANLRIRYDADTLPGASGSPCFNRKFEFVGLHHAGEPGWFQGSPKLATYNQAIPVAAILADLGARLPAKFWEIPIPTAPPPPMPMNGAAPNPAANGATLAAIARSDDDPTKALIVSSKPLLPFFNRAKLRKHLEELLDDDSNLKAVTITGLSGAGCTSSWDLVRQVAKAKNVVAGIADFSAGLSLEDACEEAAGALQLDLTAMRGSVLVDQPAPARIGRKFASYLANALKGTKSRYWLVLDSLDRPSIDPDVREHLVSWLLDYAAMDRFRNLTLIFLGQEPTAFSRLSGYSRSEQLEGVTRIELKQFFQSWAGLKGRELRPSELDTILDGVAGADPGPYRGQKLGEIRLRASVAMEVLQ